MSWTTMETPMASTQFKEKGSIIYSIHVAKPGGRDEDLMDFLQDGFHHLWFRLIMNLSFRLSSYLDFACRFIELWMHLGVMWNPFWRHLASKRNSKKTTWGPNYFKKNISVFVRFMWLVWLVAWIKKVRLESRRLMAPRAAGYICVLFDLEKHT